MRLRPRHVFLLGLAPAAGLLAPLRAPAAFTARRLAPAPRMQTAPDSDELTTNIGLTGGDEWAGSRGSKDDVRELVDEALSTNLGTPIIKQFYTSRKWLWRQWSGTIVKAVLPREVIINTCLAVAVSLFFQGPGREMTGALAGVNGVWLLACSLVTFTISFFLSQSYTVWRDVYTLTRRVQGRLNDLGLLSATAAQRDAYGEYTDGSQELLALIARYVRLFSVLLYASVTARFAPIATPAGLKVLVEANALTEEERERLLESSMAHNAVLGWIWAAIENGLTDGRLGGGMCEGVGYGGGAPTSLRLTFENKLLELRGTYASIADTLSGRMPLAYTQLVQILVDLLLFGTPFALMHSVGGAAAVFGTAVITFFYSSVLNLAKVFLDPFDNEGEAGVSDAGKSTGISINVGTLLQETCLGSERWRRSVQSLPAGARARAPAAYDAYA